DHGTVHDGIGVRQAQLDHVRAVVDEDAGGLDRPLQVGVADGQVADQGGAVLGARPVQDLSGAQSGGVGGGPRGSSSFVAAPTGPVLRAAARSADRSARAGSSPTRPNQLEAVSTSLSPRPERLTRITASSPSSRPSWSAPARACADSIAGMMPSVIDSSAKASIAGASSTARYSARPMSASQACSGPTLG